MTGHNIYEDVIWLIGAGPMAIDYAKVLKAQKIPFKVIGRGSESAKSFHEQTGIEVETGGLDNYIKKTKVHPAAAIVAVSVNELAHATCSLLEKGIKNILVEKPAGINSHEISCVADACRNNDAGVYVAYNRRFYTATLEALRIIEEDGGVTSFNFEFTEWSHVIKDLKKDTVIKKNWFLANSTHVVDLAFFLGGKPQKINCYTAGGMSWHPIASIYAGAGISENGALFSYQANWEAPGRWGVEILTNKHRLIFRPMEQLHLQKIGSVAIERVDLDYSLDTLYKPGLYQQIMAFTGNRNGLPSIFEQVAMANIYDQMNNTSDVRN